MLEITPFESQVDRYEAWFDNHKWVYESELQAIAQHIPNNSRGIEVGLGTGRYAIPLGIKEGVEPAVEMRKLARKKGLEVVDSQAESLPYGDLQFDFVLFVTICHLRDAQKAFKEAARVLKPEGKLIVAFVDRNQPIGQYYESRRKDNSFYKDAKFFTPEKVIAMARVAGFRETPKATQTLFRYLDDIDSLEPFEEGYGKGSFVVMEFTRKKKI
jgi:ubiquinone/menaquinone biosynthesis C-methylase UbiE